MFDFFKKEESQELKALKTVIKNILSYHTEKLPRVIEYYGENSSEHNMEKGIILGLKEVIGMAKSTFLK